LNGKIVLHCYIIKGHKSQVQEPEGNSGRTVLHVCIIYYHSLQGVSVCLLFGDMNIFLQATNNLELMHGPNQHPIVKNDTADRTVDLHDHTQGMGYKSQLLTWPGHGVLISKSVFLYHF
jgi:hypothetical protein